MKIYLVGGAVRDELLGREVKEKDYVIVGATVPEMLKLKYTQVGKDFPVFLHPKTKEEYALARTERKVGLGYTGFTFDTSPHVTLEEDLIRRDLTINAIAKADDGTIVDPYHGKEDLKRRLLRHVSPAFVEDPVRILRVARFAARFAELNFTVADETIDLMRTMVKSGEVNALVPERIWKEWVRALGEKHPQLFFKVLNDCNALPVLFKEIAMDSSGMTALIKVTTLTEDTEIRFATLLHECSIEDIKSLCARYRVPTDYRDLAIIVAKHHQTYAKIDKLDAEQIITLLHALDAYRRESRFEKFLIACRAIYPNINNTDFIKECFIAAKSIDVSAFAAELKGQAIADELRKERIHRVQKILK